VLGRPWTSFRDASFGCTCPHAALYYVVVREGSSAQKIRVGRNRRDAERALRKIAVAVDEGEYQPQLNIAFAEWGDQWLASLEVKRSTVRSYVPTIAYAKEVLGRKPVGRLRAEDVARFNRSLRERGISPSTRAKHLRVLGACLQSAVRHGYAARNPVRDLPPAEKPRPERKEAAYFENDETPRLFAELPDGLIKTLFLVALKTGMRQGELLALRWDDVDVIDGVIRVRRSFTAGALSSPKNHERRDVDLTRDLVELLGEWWGACGKPYGSTLVFPGETASGHLSGSNLLRRFLYPRCFVLAFRDWAPRRKAACSTRFVTRTRSARLRGSADHVAITASRPLLVEGDDRHLRALGTSRAQSSSSSARRCVRRLGLRRVRALVRVRREAALRLASESDGGASRFDTRCAHPDLRSPAHSVRLGGSHVPRGADRARAVQTPVEPRGDLV
jgi:integrase